MVFKYSLIANHRVLGAIYRPQLPVSFHRDVYGFKCLAVIDSGSYLTVLNKVYARKLGLLWDNGIETDILGIYGTKQKCYVHEFEIDIIGLPDSRRTIKAGFVDLDNVDVLLGQIGFFEHYYVKFRHPEREFCIDIR